MNSVRCSAGHVSRIDFGQEMQAPCPECGVAVFKFTDHVEPSAQASTLQSAEAVPGKESLSKDAKIKIGMVTVGAALLIGMWMSNRTVKPPVVGSTATVLPAQPTVAKAPVSAPVTIPVRQAVSSLDATKMHIKDLQILVMDGDSVRVKFTLAKDGAPTTTFPNLLVNWTGSSQPPLRIGSGEYSHPPQFTQFDVTTEFIKPADATGLTISIQG